MASDEAVGGGFIGGKEGLELALHAGEERKSWEAWYFDSESSGNMLNGCKKTTNFRPCNKFMRIANGTHVPIESLGSLVEF